MYKRQRQPQCVNSEVLFAPVDALPAVVAATGRGLLDRLDALGVEDGRGRIRRASRGLAGVITQRVMDGLPGPVIALELEIVIHGAPQWEVMRQCPPDDAFAYDGEDRVDDLASGHRGGSTTGSGLRDVRLNAVPLGLGQVAGVWLP